MTSPTTPTRIIAKFTNIAGFDKRLFHQKLDSHSNNLYKTSKSRILYCGGGRVYVIFEPFNSHDFDFKEIEEKVLDLDGMVYNKRKVEVGLCEIGEMKVVFRKYGVVLD